MTATVARNLNIRISTLRPGLVIKACSSQIQIIKRRSLRYCLINLQHPNMRFSTILTFVALLFVTGANACKSDDDCAPGRKSMLHTTSNSRGLRL